MTQEKNERVAEVTQAILDDVTCWTLQNKVSGRVWTTRCGYTREEIELFITHTDRSVIVTRHFGPWTDRNERLRMIVAKKEKK